MLYSSKRRADDPPGPGRHATDGETVNEEIKTGCATENPIAQVRRTITLILMALVASSGVAIEDILDHAAGELMLAEKYLAGVFFFQQHRLFFAVRAHDRLDARVDRACDLDHTANF